MARGAEMTGFLGYDRYQKSNSNLDNCRNGYSQKERWSCHSLLFFIQRECPKNCVNAPAC
jgi:hypothetical protein